MKKASIDIGSNTILLLAGDFQGRSISPFLNESRVTSLGKDLDKTKKFCEESMTATYDAFQEYSILLNDHKIKSEEVILTATEASRVATNSRQLFSRMKSDFGFDIEIINAEGEAYYSALGVSLGMTGSSQETVVLDIGGASTELIKVQLNPFKVIQSVSLPIGSVRGTDWMKDKVFEENMEGILSQYNLAPYTCETMICTAGTMVTSAAMFLGLENFSEKACHGFKTNPQKINKFLNGLSKLSANNILSKFPVVGKRAETILAGITVAVRILSRLNVKEAEISTYGLRYGTLFEGEIQNEFKLR